MLQYDNGTPLQQTNKQQTNNRTTDNKESPTNNINQQQPTTSSSSSSNSNSNSNSQDDNDDKMISAPPTTTDPMIQPTNQQINLHTLSLPSSCRLFLIILKPICYVLKLHLIVLGFSWDHICQSRSPDQSCFLFHTTIAFIWRHRSGRDTRKHTQMLELSWNAKTQTLFIAKAHEKSLWPYWTCETRVANIIFSNNAQSILCPIDFHHRFSSLSPSLAPQIANLISPMAGWH